MGSVGRDVIVYADVPNRLLGTLLDAILLSLLAFFGAVALSLAFGPLVRFDVDAYSVTVDQRLAVANAILSLLLGGGYFVGSYLLLHASPGHRLLAMRLRPADPDRRISLGSALLRWLLLAAPFGLASVATTLLAGVADGIVAFAALLWYAVLLVTTGRDPAKRGLHDRAAGTTMVKTATAVGARAADE